MLEVKNITKQFNSGKSTVTALNDINLKVETSEFVLNKRRKWKRKINLTFYNGRDVESYFG